MLSYHLTCTTVLCALSFHVELLLILNRESDFPAGGCFDLLLIIQELISSTGINSVVSKRGIF